MRFLLSCIVCLGLLYAMILRHDGYLVDPTRLAADALAAPGRAGAGLAAAAGPQMAARVEAYCRHDPAACLAAAAAMTRPLAIPLPPRRDGRVTLGAATP